MFHHSPLLITFFPSRSPTLQQSTFPVWFSVFNKLQLVFETCNRVQSISIMVAMTINKRVVARFFPIHFRFFNDFISFFPANFAVFHNYNDNVPGPGRCRIVCVFINYAQRDPKIIIQSQWLTHFGHFKSGNHFIDIIELMKINSQIYRFIAKVHSPM